jgi:hypothetical protein
MNIRYLLVMAYRQDINNSNESNSNLTQNLMNIEWK